MNYFRSLKIVLLLVILFISPLGLLAQQSQPSAEEQEANGLFVKQDWPNAIKAYQAIITKNDKNGRAWYRLGYAQYSLKHFQEAVDAWQHTVAINSSNATAMYNIACAYAKMSQANESLNWLDRAVKAGFAPLSQIQSDEDLASLRELPKYKEILTTADKLLRPCAYSAEARQFDFWIGEWDVFVNGQKAGTNNVQLLLDQCVLMENWSGNGGSDGKSFNFYNVALGKWQQTWVDNRGSTLLFYGEYKDNAMHFTGETVQSDGSKILQKLTFFKFDNGNVRQFWEQSNDNGKTWTVAFDGLYVRKK